MLLYSHSLENECSGDEFEEDLLLLFLCFLQSLNQMRPASGLQKLAHTGSDTGKINSTQHIHQTSVLP